MEASGRYDGKVCVVTGGTQGVGLATARQMAGRGASGIVICGRQAKAGQAAAEEITASGTPTEFVRADLTDVDQCFAVVDCAQRVFGRADVLANVAGMTSRGTIEDTSPESFDGVFALNVRAPFFLMQRVIPLMREAGGGAIVNVISVAAHGGAPYIAAYSASKAALQGLTKNVANTVAGDRIRVNGINMGWTATPSEAITQTTHHADRYVRPANWKAEAGQKMAFGRIFEPEEVGRCIVFLSTGESAIATGAIIDFEQFVIGVLN